MTRSKRHGKYWLDWEPRWYRRMRYRRFVRQRSRQLIREGKVELMPKPYRDGQADWW